MQYIVYADVLFLQYFGLNLILLGCLNRRFPYSATWGKLFFCAGMGALWATLGIAKAAPGFSRYVCSPGGTLGMLLLAYPELFRQSFPVLMKETLIDSFYIGGCYLALRQILTFLGMPQWGMACMMFPAGIALILLAPSQSGQEAVLGHAVLQHKGRKIETLALVDTGNSLCEPISGKPVAIIEKTLLEQLLGKEEEGYRVIPYHSIGTEHGLLCGYCIEKLRLRMKGETRYLKDVYLAAAPEGISLSEKNQGENSEGIGLLLQPRFWQ